MAVASVVSLSIGPHSVPVRGVSSPTHILGPLLYSQEVRLSLLPWSSVDLEWKPRSREVAIPWVLWK